MADKVRVKLLRTVQGENEVGGGEKEILVKDSVVEVSPLFAAEIIGSRAAEVTDAKPVKVPLHPEEPKAAAK